MVMCQTMPRAPEELLVSRPLLVTSSFFSEVLSSKLSPQACVAFQQN